MVEPAGSPTITPRLWGCQGMAPVSEPAPSRTVDQPEAGIAAFPVASHPGGESDSGGMRKIVDRAAFTTCHIDQRVPSTKPGN